jgi:hypothetical protein
MKKITSYQILTILATLLTITVNGLANGLPLNGQGTGEISDRFSILFVPAGYVFSIWGLIYLGLIAFTIYQALPAQNDNRLLRKISPAYWVGSLANTAWIFMWHYEFFPYTVVLMLMILITLIAIFRDISAAGSGLNNVQKWFVRIPFSIYLGWISVATIANVTQILFFFDWGGWGISPTVWALIMLVVATILGLLMQWRERAVSYVLVLVWAFWGIGVSQAGTLLVANTARGAAIVLIAAAILMLFLKPGSKPAVK